MRLSEIISADRHRIRLRSEAVAPYQGIPRQTCAAGQTYPYRYPSAKATATAPAPVQGSPAHARRPARATAAEGRRRPTTAGQAAQAGQARDSCQVNGERNNCSAPIIALQHYGGEF